MMDTKDLIQSALDGDASGFKDGINTKLLDKVKDALDVKRMEISGTYFNEPKVEAEVDSNLEKTELSEKQFVSEVAPDAPDPAKLLRLGFGSDEKAQEAVLWMNKNLPPENMGFAELDHVEETIMFGEVDDVKGLMGSLKKAGFKISLESREAHSTADIIKSIEDRQDAAV